MKSLSEASRFSAGLKISYQNHSIPYWIVVQPGCVILPFGMQAYIFFSFENLWNLKKKKKMQRVFPGQESSAPWKFGAPVSQGLAEVTDRAAAEPGRLGFIGPDLSVRRGLQASA